LFYEITQTDVLDDIYKNEIKDLRDIQDHQSQNAETYYGRFSIKTDLYVLH